MILGRTNRHLSTFDPRSCSLPYPDRTADLARFDGRLCLGERYAGVGVL